MNNSDEAQLYINSMTLNEMRKNGIKNITLARLYTGAAQIVQKSSSSKLRPVKNTVVVYKTPSWEKSFKVVIAFLKRYKMKETLEAIKAEFSNIPTTTGFKYASELEMYLDNLVHKRDRSSVFERANEFATEVGLKKAPPLKNNPSQKLTEPHWPPVYRFEEKPHQPPVKQEKKPATPKLPVPNYEPRNYPWGPPPTRPAIELEETPHLTIKPVTKLQIQPLKATAPKPHQPEPEVITLSKPDPKPSPRKITPRVIEQTKPRVAPKPEQNQKPKRRAATMDFSDSFTYSDVYSSDFEDSDIDVNSISLVDKLTMVIEGKKPPAETSIFRTGGRQVVKEEEPTARPRRFKDGTVLKRMSNDPLARFGRGHTLEGRQPKTLQQAIGSRERVPKYVPEAARRSSSTSSTSRREGEKLRERENSKEKTHHRGYHHSGSGSSSGSEGGSGHHHHHHHHHHHSRH